MRGLGAKDLPTTSRPSSLRSTQRLAISASSCSLTTHRLHPDWELVRPEGVEPPAFWSVAKRSIQLSYGRHSIPAGTETLSGKMPRKTPRRLDAEWI